MSEQRPYEELPDQQFNDLPVPDMEESWQQMKQLLEEDEDNDRILPPIFLSCAGWGLFLLLLLVGFWFTFHPERWWKKKETAQQKVFQSFKQTTSSENRSSNSTVTIKKKDEQQVKKGQLKEDSTKEIITVTSDLSSKEKQITSSVSGKINTYKGQVQTSHFSGSNKRVVNKKKKSKTSKDKRNNYLVSNNKKHQHEVTDIETTNASLNSQKQKTEVKDSSIVQNNLTDKSTVKQDTLKRQSTPTDQVSTKDKTHPKKKAQKKFYVSAGIGLQQQIPLNGQKAVPYNYYGRKGSLSDYIPSVYVRLERDKKWFVQGEFRYGAPQSVKEVAYSQKTKTDTFGTISTTTTQRVKKTYYHQVPLNFNYYILPNWSVGTGLLYSRFYGAVTEQEVNLRNNITQRDSIISKKIMTIPASADSFFTKSQIQVLFQSEYQWKRFSFGLRYTKGLQPYIRYTDANGEAKEEKDMSLQLYLRFRLVKTKVGSKN